MHQLDTEIGMDQKRWIDALNLQALVFEKLGSILNKLFLLELQEVHKAVMLGVNGSNDLTGLLYLMKHMKNKS